MTAYYQMPGQSRARACASTTAAQPPIADTVAQATAAGAEFIVGPLTREEVMAAADLLTTRGHRCWRSISCRPTARRPSASTSSRCRRKTMRARWRVTSAPRGRRHGVVIVPEGDWGTRVAAAFDEELRAAGGFVLGPGHVQRRRQGLRRGDHAGAAHRRQPRAPAAHPGRHRPEARVRAAPPRRHPVHLRAQPAAAAARLLRPQLRFHLAGDIPTYTLGDAYEPHPTANQEIDGVMFPDMPWMLGDDQLSAEVRAAAAQAYRRIRRAPRTPVRVRLSTRCASRLRCSAAAPINPAGPHRHAEHGCAGSRAPRARVGAHQGRHAHAARAAAPPRRRAQIASLRAPPAMDRRQTGSLRREQRLRISRDRRASPSSRAISCAASANSTWWRAPATCW